MGDRLRIVTLAGGTGSYTVLSGLKHFFDRISLTAVVGTSDNGGSSGRLRVGDNLILPAGDPRQAGVALLPPEDGISFDLLTGRFERGELKGHAVGNLMITFFQNRYGRHWYRQFAEYFKLRGLILPVTDVATTLCAQLANGDGLVGEDQIDKHDPHRAAIERVYYQYRVPALPETLQAIDEADVVVIGPGDIYTSIAPILLVDGVKEALARTSAKKLYVVNLVTKPGHTEGFTAKRHCHEIQRYLGQAMIDHVILNSAKPNRALVDRYESHGEKLVNDDFDGSESFQVHRSDLLSQNIIEPIPGDALPRSLIRHDSGLLAEAILTIACSSV